MRDMMNKTWTIGAVCGALALGGCGDDGNEPQADTADTSNPDISETETSADAVAMTGNIDGTWAMVETQSALVEVLGAVMEQKSVSYYRAVIADGKLTVELCDWLTEDDTKLYTTRMSDALLASLTSFERDVTVTANGGGFEFETTQGITTRGVNLTNPLTDTMPVDGADERVFDQDEDTKSGITLVIQGTLQGEPLRDPPPQGGARGRARVRHAHQRADRVEYRPGDPRREPGVLVVNRPQAGDPPGREPQPLRHGQGDRRR